MKRLLRTLIYYISITLIVLGLLTSTSVWAKDYTFSWVANNSVEGYKLYYKKGGPASAPFKGTDAFEGPSPISVSNSSSLTISGLEDNTTYHFAMTAYSGSQESDFTPIITVFPEEYLKQIMALQIVYKLLMDDL